MKTHKERLLQLLREKSFRYNPDQPFKLVSGRVSPYYIDCRPTTHNAEGLFLIGELFWEMLRDLEVDAVGGLTMGADPMAQAIALTSYLKGKPINAFSVRKGVKEHGTGGLVVGDVKPGDKVVILEDVITTGASTLKAIVAARDFGLEVIRVLILVDRQEGGWEAVAAVAPQVQALFTLEELKTA
ncbi:MAG: orotate phosphoribosyltransferase [Deltaproteobacteria bacterium]|nr:orotate phosphoribosyltransferase [Deltaproteobacteria bacterium]